MATRRRNTTHRRRTHRRGKRFLAGVRQATYTDHFRYRLGMATGRQLLRLVNIIRVRKGLPPIPIKGSWSNPTGKAQQSGNTWHGMAVKTHPKGHKRWKWPGTISVTSSGLPASRRAGSGRVAGRPGQVPNGRPGPAPTSSARRAGGQPAVASQKKPTKRTATQPKAPAQPAPKPAATAQSAPAQPAPVVVGPWPGSGPVQPAPAPPSTTPAPATSGNAAPALRTTSTDSGGTTMDGEFLTEAPETDAEFVGSMRGFAGDLFNLSAKMEEFQATLLERVGLDSAAVTGIGRASESLATSASTVNDVIIDFMTTYEGIIETVQNGTKIPGNTFFTGDVD